MADENASQTRGLIEGNPGESLFYKIMFDLPRSHNELPELFRKVEGMDDHRLLAIVTALLIESRIDKLLGFFLPKYAKLIDNKDFTFSAKITLLEALNFIPPLITTACHRLRSVRNEFAHHLEKKEFSDIDNKYLRPLRALRDEAYRGKEAPHEGERSLMDVFKGLSFFCIIALDAYSINVRILREYIERRDFIESLHNQIHHKSLAWLKEVTAGRPIRIERQGNTVIEHFESGVANVRDARPEDDIPPPESSVTQ